MLKNSTLPYAHATPRPGCLEGAGEPRGCTFTEPGCCVRRCPGSDLPRHCPAACFWGTCTDTTCSARSFTLIQFGSPVFDRSKTQKGAKSEQVSKPGQSLMGSPLGTRQCAGAERGMDKNRECLRETPLPRMIKHINLHTGADGGHTIGVSHSMICVVERMCRQNKVRQVSIFQRSLGTC